MLLTQQVRSRKGCVERSNIQKEFFRKALDMPNKGIVDAGTFIMASGGSPGPGTRVNMDQIPAQLPQMLGLEIKGPARCLARQGLYVAIHECLADPAYRGGVAFAYRVYTGALCHTLWFGNSPDVESLGFRLA
jgi:hypothetical protein